MKKQIPLLILAAFGFTSCATTGSNTAMVPLRSVEEVERQAPVTYNPNGISEALGARNAVNTMGDVNEALYNVHLTRGLINAW